MRTLRELDPREQDFLRAVVEDLGERTYNEDDVGEYFDVTSRTVAALKAHRTMREQEYNR